MAKKWFSIVSLMVIASMLLVACGAEPTTVPATATTAAAAPTATTAAAAAPTATTGAAKATATTGGTSGGTMDYSEVGDELAAAMEGEYDGTKVTMFGPFGDEDEVKFNNSMK